jgi:O-antigen/teichoic acid export membrane protein
MTNKNAPSLKSGIKWNILSAGVMILSKLIRGAIIPKILSPASYGLFTSISLFTRYIQYSDFGAGKYFAKEFPHYHFNKNESEKHDFASETYSLIILSFVMISAYLVLMAVFYNGESADFYEVAFLLLIPSTIFLKAREFYMSYALGMQNYKFNALGSIGSDVLSLVMAVVGIYFYGPMGGVAGMIVVEAILFFYMKSILVKPFVITFHKGMFKHIKQIFKQFSVSITELLVVTIDQWFIFRVFKLAGLGIYSLGLTFGWLMVAISGVIVTSIHPKLMVTAKHSKQEAIDLLNKSLFYYFLACLLITPIAIYCIEIVITYFLDKYVVGLQVYFIMMFSGMVKGAVSIVRLGFVAMDMEKKYIYFSVGNILLFSLGYVLAYFFGFSFYQVIAMVAVMDVFGLFLLYSALNKEKGENFWRNIGMLALAFLFFVSYQFLFRQEKFVFFDLNFGVLLLVLALFLFSVIAIKNRTMFIQYLK